MSFTLGKKGNTVSLLHKIITGCLFAANIAMAGPEASSIEYSRYVKYPKIDVNKHPDRELIQKGEYLVKIGDCASCHTSLEPGAKTFAGGLGIQTPFGTFYSPNITPDKETGIGTWNDDDFANALHKGFNPTGSYYFPVFPYPYFTKISREDALAIKAYLFSLQPVHAPKKKNDVPFPFSWRFLQLGWRILFFNFRHDYFHPDLQQSADWNRGAYLVQGLGHCGMCHTPLNFLGAAKNKYYLGGGQIAEFYAPDITARAWVHTPLNELAQAIKAGKYPGTNQEMQGPMMEVSHNSLRFLTAEDARAIATYLETVQSAPQGAGLGNASGGGLMVGKQVYDGKCQACHSTGAGGAPKIDDKAAWEPRVALGMDTLVQHAIHGINAMPPRGTCGECSDEQIEEAVKYMVSEAQGGAEDSRPVGPKPKQATLALGEQVYGKHCAMCHNEGMNGAPLLGNKAQWSCVLKSSMDVLIDRTIHGYRNMPPRGGCETCQDVELIAAVKYMAQQSQAGDYQLW